MTLGRHKSHGKSKIFRVLPSKVPGVSGMESTVRTVYVPRLPVDLGRWLSYVKKWFHTCPFIKRV